MEHRPVQHVSLASAVQIKSIATMLGPEPVLVAPWVTWIQPVVIRKKIRKSFALQTSLSPKAQPMRSAHMIQSSVTQRCSKSTIGCMDKPSMYIPRIQLSACLVTRQMASASGVSVQSWRASPAGRQARTLSLRVNLSQMQIKLNRRLTFKSIIRSRGHHL